MFKALGSKVRPNPINRKETQKYLQRLDDEDSADKPKNKEAKNKEGITIINYDVGDMEETPPLSVQ